MVGSQTLTQSRDSEYDQEKAKRRLGIVNTRARAVVDLHLSGHSADEIAEMLGYASRASVYQLLSTDKVRALIQEVMDYYDQTFRTLYPEVISAVSSALVSSDEKVQLEASKIWLKSHGKLDNRQQEQKGPEVTIENMVANILIQAKEEDDSRSTSDRKLVQDSGQAKTDRRFQTQPESGQVR